MAEALNYNDKLEQIHRPLLKEGIDGVAAQFPAGVARFPRQTNFYSREFVDIAGEMILACAPSALINCVSALGVEPSTDIEMLTKRLWAGQRHLDPRQIPFITQPEGSRFSWVTQDGIAKLCELARNPLRKAPLPLLFFQTADLGTFHQALAHGYTGLYVDQHIKHAISVVGMQQREKEAVWAVLPPDVITVELIRKAAPDVEEVQTAEGMAIYYIDPEISLRRIDFPMWIMGKAHNPWIPPKDKEPERIDLGDIILE